jgi:dCMP deaminase
MSWDDRWMHMCTEFAQFSKDRSRKIGAIVVYSRSQNIVTSGWNGFPRNINDDIEERHKRPEKDYWTVHAERNAFYNAARLGRSTDGCTMYMPWYPCAGCSQAIVQCGIVEVVVVEPDWDDLRWKEDFAKSKEMLSEAKVRVRFYTNPKILAPVMLPMTS